MLETMRRNSQSFLIYVLFGAIIAVFVISFGPSGQGMGPVDPGFAAKVDGEVISAEEFRRAYGARVRLFQAQSPRGIDPKLLKQFNIKQNVLDELIDERLLRQAARDNGLKVSASELRDFLREQPAFQTDGKFDYKAYERYVNFSMGSSPARYEEDLAARLLSSKYRDAIENAINVSDAEVLQDYLLNEDKVDLNFVAFKQDDAGAVADPTAAEVAAFEKDHGSEIEARYKRDSNKYNEPKKNRARHILIKVAEGAPEAEVQKAEAKIKDLEKQLAGGKDFAELAKAESEDSSKDKGGDLGWFGPGVMVKAFEDATNALKPGELSKPVRSPFGFHLIKLEEVKEAQNRTLEAVRGEIAKALVLEQKRDQAIKAKAEKLLADLKGGKQLKDLAVAEPDFGDDAAKKDPSKLTYKQTGSFSKAAAAIPKIGLSDELKTLAFSLSDSKKVADKVVKVNDRYYVVELKERSVADEAKFKEKRDELRQTAVGRKRGEVVRELTKSLRDKASVEVNPRVLSYDEV